VVRRGNRLWRIPHPLSTFADPPDPRRAARRQRAKQTGPAVPLGPPIQGFTIEGSIGRTKSTGAWRQILVKTSTRGPAENGSCPALMWPRGWGTLSRRHRRIAKALALERRPVKWPGNSVFVRLASAQFAAGSVGTGKVSRAGHALADCSLKKTDVRSFPIPSLDAKTKSNQPMETGVWKWAARALCHSIRQMRQQLLPCGSAS